MIPTSLRPTIRECLPGPHSGIQSCLRRSRETDYWPNMTAEIKDCIAKCEVCATYQKEQPKEPLICHKNPSRPLETVRSDIFHFQDKDYLGTVDYYSNYFAVDFLKDKTASEVIQVLKRHFARHGIPNRLVSDNGPPFNSHEFQHFAESYDTEHFTSSPHYPQSNGKVENSVKTVKTLMKNSKAARSDMYLAFLEWRNTPSEGLASSPAQRMFEELLSYAQWSCLETTKLPKGLCCIEVTV